MEAICTAKRRLQLELRSTKSQKASVIVITVKAFQRTVFFHRRSFVSTMYERNASNWRDRVTTARFEVFTAVTMKNAVFWDVSRAALVRTDVSEELSASIIPL
jgi:hypothetical protein